MTKHTHAFVSISKTKEKCGLCDQYRKKVKAKVPCSKCNKTEPKEKYYPYCCAEHWGIAVRAEPK